MLQQSSVLLDFLFAVEQAALSNICCSWHSYTAERLGAQVLVVHNCGPWEKGSSQPLVDAIPAPLEPVEALGRLLPCAVRGLPDPHCLLYSRPGTAAVVCLRAS